MLVELGIGVLLATAAYRASRPQGGVMTPTMRAIFTHAVNRRNPAVPPTELLRLADVLDRAQLPAYSELLRKRAALALRSPELKNMHRDAYRMAMGCADPLRMRVAATAFEKMGMTGCAAALRNQAAALDAATLASAVAPPPPPAPDPITDAYDTGDVPLPSQAAPTASQVAAQPAATAGPSAPADVADSVGTQDNLASAEIDQALAGSSVGDETGVDPDNQDLDDFITFGTNGPTPLTADAPAPGVPASTGPAAGPAGPAGPAIDTPDGPAPMPSGLSPEAANAGFQSDAEYQEFMSGTAAE
jgi:hypothetical protein